MEQCHASSGYFSPFSNTTTAHHLGRYSLHLLLGTKELHDWGSGQEVIVLAFYDDQSSNPAEVHSFLCCLKRTMLNKKRPWMVHFLKNWLNSSFLIMNQSNDDVFLKRSRWTKIFFCLTGTNCVFRVCLIKWQAMQKYKIKQPIFVEVMGGDSPSEGCGFKSQHRILDGHFSHTLAEIIVLFETTKINEKEANFKYFWSRCQMFLNGPNLGLFFIYFLSFQTNNTILTTNKCENVIPI